MSLINQMLKELDARRSDAGESAPFGFQVRAVPERRRVHPAWWVALVLGVSLLALLAWTLTRQAAVDPYLVRAQLPLKLEVDLAADLAPVAVVSSASGNEPATPDPASDPNGATSESAPVGAMETVRPRAEPLNAPAEAALDAPTATPLVTPARTDTRGAAPARPLVDAPVTREPAVAPSAVLPPAPPIHKQVRELTPQQQAENAFRKATSALQQGGRSEAQEGLEQALQLEPRHAGARQALIALLVDGNRSDEAIRYARDGLGLDPQQGGLAMILARLQLEKNDLSGALETLERSRVAGGERADYVAFHAALLQRAERHKEAAEQYLHALRKVPNNGLWWMGLGISLQAEQRNGEARDAFKRAKESNSLSPELAAFVDARLAKLK